MKKPTPDEVAKLRELYPKGAPRIDYREMPLSRKRAPIADPDAGAGEVDDAEARAATDANAPIPIAISSEAPVLRYDWWDDEYYYEVLDHSAKSVILDYARDGMPFVASHRSYDADQQHGIVENVRVEKKILRGDVLMSRAQRSQEIAQDMRDGIRKKVSVGYIVGDQYDQTEKAKDGIPIRRYTAWMPIETSTVPVPADYAVGVGRAQSAEGQAALARFLTLAPRAAATTQTIHTPADGERSAAAAPAPSPAVPSTTTQAPKAEERTMANEAAAPGGATGTVTEQAAAAATSVVTVGADREREAAAQRVDDINHLAAQHGLTDRASKWIRDGRSTSEVIKEIDGVLAERLKNGPQVVQGVEVAKRDRKKFSFARMLIMAEPSLERDAGRLDFGLEKEVLEEIRKQIPMLNGRGNGLLPFSLSGDQLFRAGIDSATSTTGGAFKFTQPGEFIAMLRNKTSVMRAGATILPGLTGPVTFPKQNGAATANWVGENPGSDNSASNLTTTTVSLSFKTIQASTSVSRQALFSAASGNYALDAIIQGDLARVIAIAIDLAGLNGLGSSNQPLGLLQDTNVGTATALGAQGGTMAWSNWVDLETAVGDANADDISTLSYITNTKQRGQAKKVGVLGNTASGIPIWSNVPGQMDGIVNGYRAIASNQVPRNLTKGTQTTVCSAVIFGAFEQLLIGMFGAGYEVLVDPFSKKNQNMIELTAWNFVDVANRYPTAFATIKDAL